ncbi:MAG TPA: hypothetical protein VLK65_31520 [Vicinamibacteria bacterium]|nr:hypothetical protein [Vicinamibacteria bacterium]
MKQGINLGLERVERNHPLARLVWPTLFLVTLLHGFRALRTGEELAALREEVSGVEEGLETESPAMDDAILQRLRQISASGLAAGHSATAILALIDSSLPSDMSLVALTIHPMPPSADVVIDARAQVAEDVTSFQRNLAGSPLVSSTSLLEERRAADGFLSVRLRLELRAP